MMSSKPLPEGIEIRSASWRPVPDMRALPLAEWYFPSDPLWFNDKAKRDPDSSNAGAQRTQASDPSQPDARAEE